MQERIITLHPGERAIVYTTPPPRRLNHVQWNELVAAEQRIFKGESGYISYTDVNLREEDFLAATMWEHAFTQMDAAGEFEHEGGRLEGQRKSDDVIRRLVASRTARALAILVFGPEFLLK